MVFLMLMIEIVRAITEPLSSPQLVILIKLEIVARFGRGWFTQLSSRGRHFEIDGSDRILKVSQFLQKRQAEDITLDQDDKGIGAPEGVPEFMKSFDFRGIRRCKAFDAVVDDQMVSHLIERTARHREQRR